MFHLLNLAASLNAALLYEGMIVGLTVNLDTLPWLLLYVDVCGDDLVILLKEMLTELNGKFLNASDLAKAAKSAENRRTW